MKKIAFRLFCLLAGLVSSMAAVSSVHADCCNSTVPCTSCYAQGVTAVSTDQGGYTEYLNTVPTPTYPKNIIGTCSPVFTWKSITGAEQYRLKIYTQVGELILDRSLTRDYCTSTDCTYDPGISLPGCGAYKYEIYGGSKEGVRWGQASAEFVVDCASASCPDCGIVRPSACDSCDNTTITLANTECEPKCSECETCKSCCPTVHTTIVQPAPVVNNYEVTYVQPTTTVVQPAPVVYQPAPVVYQPVAPVQPVVYQPQPQPVAQPCGPSCGGQPLGARPYNYIPPMHYN